MKPGDTPVASSGDLPPTRFAQILLLWLVLRVVTSLWVAVLSPKRPLTDIEKAVPLWPPSSPVAIWMERAFLAPWERWDAIWYKRILMQGYRADDGTAQFHPLYPWLAASIARLGIHPTLALLLVSSLSTVLLLLLFERLARLDLAPEHAHTATLLFAFFPVSFILYAPYSEALFLCFAVLCLLWARRGQWSLAGIAGGLAALTRQQGVFLTLPVAWELWTGASGDIRQILRNWRAWITLAAIPTGMLVWVFYRAIALSDLSPNFDSFHHLIYSLLISPSAEKVVPVQGFLWPWQAIWRALDTIRITRDLHGVIDLTLAAYFLALLALGWRGMNIGYRLYSVAIALVSFSYYTGPVYPYMGMPRHLLLAFPVFIGLGTVVRRPWQRARIDPFLRLFWRVLSLALLCIPNMGSVGAQCCTLGPTFCCCVSRPSAGKDRAKGVSI